MIARMRTITEAVAEIKAADPHTALTVHALRQLILSGKVPSIMAGKKYLINLDTLIEYLSGICAQAAPPAPKGIRRIPERL